jgi:hypothetical protein
VAFNHNLRQITRWQAIAVNKMSMTLYLILHIQAIYIHVAYLIDLDVTGGSAVGPNSNLTRVLAVGLKSGVFIRVPDVANVGPTTVQQH